MHRAARGSESEVSGNREFKCHGLAAFDAIIRAGPSQFPRAPRAWRIEAAIPAAALPLAPAFFLSNGLRSSPAG